MKDVASLPFTVVMHSLVSTPEELCFRVSVNKVKGSFGSGNMNIGLPVSVASIASKLC